MIRATVVALALCVVSSAQSMPYVPLQQPDNSVIPVRQGCGLGRQLVDGICVSNTKVACRGPQVQLSKNAHGERSL
jgi:hypothetical protein